jgi:hypothetical protein
MAVNSFSDISTADDVQIIGGELVVSDSTAVYFGLPSVNGSYRVVRDGNDLNIERRESGTWVEKEATLP